MFADVLFPLKASAFTYAVPSALAPLPPGTLVSAPLGKRETQGLVVGVSERCDTQGRPVRELLSAHGTFASPEMLRLLAWFADYYLSTPGMALKSAFFSDAVTALKPRKRKAAPKPAPACDIPLDPVATGDSILRELADSARVNSYATHLVHVPDQAFELSLAASIAEALRDGREGIMILVPELRFLAPLEARLRDPFGDRLVVLHGKLTARERADRIGAILQGKSDVVLGTRSAVLAPLPRTSLIMVLGEQSRSYKAEEGARYHARDVAVMRGFIEHCPVLLFSCAPSLESVLNCRKEKYRFVDTLSSRPARRPFVKTVKSPFGKPLSREIVTEIRAALKSNKSVLVLAGRTGYGMLRCSDCGHVPACPSCEAPAVYYKAEVKLRCHRCRTSLDAPSFCEACGGTRLKPFSLGTERVREEIAALLPTAGPAGKAPDIESPAALPVEDETLRDFSSFVVGASRFKADPCLARPFGGALVLNSDLLLGRPDFRAHERVLQELIEISGLVDERGTILLQTAQPSAPFFRHLRRYDFDGLYEFELQQRAALNFPPYTRMIQLSILFAKGEEKKLSAVEKLLAFAPAEGVERLGPLPLQQPSPRYGGGIQLVLKASDSVALRREAREIVGRLEGVKGIDVVAEVDPLTI